MMRRNQYRNRACSLGAGFQPFFWVLGGIPCLPARYGRDCALYGRPPPTKNRRHARQVVRYEGEDRLRLDCGQPDESRLAQSANGLAPSILQSCNLMGRVGRHQQFAIGVGHGLAED